MAREFTDDERTEISRAYSAGNYANAYETQDLDECETDAMPEHERAAFILGFYSSCELNEISDREAFDEAYWSDAGQYVVKVAGYCDDRAEDYTAEAAAGL